MQLISVERYTFWAAVVLAVFGPVMATGFSTYCQPGTGGCVGFGSGLAVVVVILLILSWAMGGTHDPAVRQVPAPHT